MAEANSALLDVALPLAPSLASGVASVVVDGDMVLWPNAGAATAVDRFVAAVLPHLDGSLTLKDASADLSFAASADIGMVEWHITSEVLRLSRLGVLRGVPGDLQTLAEEQPGPVKTEVLPNGARLLTVTLEFSTRNPEQRSIVEALVSGDKSQLDVLPPDSCVGSKIRSGIPADRFAVSIGGRVIGVRCHHEPTSAHLSRRWTSTNRDDGMTVAVVTAPFEGVGPPRVYDVGAQRVGRPRDGQQAADIVASLVNEFRPAPEEGVVVGATVVVSGMRCALLPPGLFSEGRLKATLERRGLRLLPTRRALVRRGTVVTEGASGAANGRFQSYGVFTPDQLDGLSPRSRAVLQLLDGPARLAPQSRQKALSQLAAWVSSDHDLVVRPLPREAGEVADVLSNLLNPATQE